MAFLRIDEALCAGLFHEPLGLAGAGSAAPGEARAGSAAPDPQAQRRLNAKALNMAVELKRLLSSIRTAARRTRKSRNPVMLELKALVRMRAGSAAPPRTPNPQPSPEEVGALASGRAAGGEVAPSEAPPQAGGEVAPREAPPAAGGEVVLREPPPAAGGDVVLREGRPPPVTGGDESLAAEVQEEDGGYDEGEEETS